MASSMMVSSAAAVGQTNMIAEFSGLKSASAFPAATRRAGTGLAKLPTNSGRVQCMKLGECKKEYPKAFIRIIGFDNNRQVQCVSFIAHKPY